MATRYNYTGGIVTDGLVLNLDAAKVDSYPGTGTAWYDISGNNNNGTLTNGPTFSGIGKQAAIVFDGTNDYVNCGDIIRGRTTFSAEAWINTTDTRVGVNATYHNPSIFGTQHGSDVSGDFAMTLKSGYLGFYHELGGYGHIDTGVFVADGTWRHVAVIKTTGGTMTVYHNGTQVYTGTGYTATLRTIDLQYYNWELGRAYWYGEDSNMMRYTGRIGAHKLYNRALSATEITQNFNALRGRYGI